MDNKIRPRHPEKVKNPINPIKKKPTWIRSKLTNSKEFFLTKTIVNKNNLVTVCQEANCPNITECWSKRHATFMIMGDTCTRACAFCDVKTGKPGKLDELEPIKISQAVKKLNLKHVVITSVDRDDLDDGGAEHFAKTWFPEGFHREHYYTDIARGTREKRRCESRRKDGETEQA